MPQQPRYVGICLTYIAKLAPEQRWGVGVGGRGERQNGVKRTAAAHKSHTAPLSGSLTPVT